MREKRLEELAITRRDADCHPLSCIRRVFLDRNSVPDVTKGEAQRERPELGFISNVQCDGIRARRDRVFDGFARCVDELGGLYAEGKVGADDAVVRQVGRVNERFSWLRTLHPAQN